MREKVAHLFSMNLFLAYMRLWEILERDLFNFFPLYFQVPSHSWGQITQWYRVSVFISKMGMITPTSQNCSDMAAQESSSGEPFRSGPTSTHWFGLWWPCLWYVIVSSRPYLTGPGRSSWPRLSQSDSLISEFETENMRKPTNRQLLELGLSDVSWQAFFLQASCCSFWMYLFL